jgi:hypothetical protein
LASHLHLSPRPQLQIASGATECVFEEVKVGDTLEMWFEIVRGDDLSIHFKLGGPGDVLVHERIASFAEKCVARGVRYDSNHSHAPSFSGV